MEIKRIELAFVINKEGIDARLLVSVKGCPTFILITNNSYASILFFSHLIETFVFSFFVSTEPDGDDTPPSWKLKEALERPGPPRSSTPQQGALKCTLCQEDCGTDFSTLENHLLTVHHVTSGMLQRLLAEVASGNTTAAATLAMKLKPPADDGRPQQGPGSQEANAKDLQVGMSVSEKHVYKYRCNQCSLAFKTLDKLQLHSQYHVIRESTSCSLCSRTFRSVQSLQKHLETGHPEVPASDLQKYKESILNNPVVQAGMSGRVLEPGALEVLKGQEDTSEEEHTKEETQESADPASEEAYSDPTVKFKCHRCRVGFMRQVELQSHQRSPLHKKYEKMGHPIEKYLDPNRPFKCDICKESFTQKNILLVHYNSVSHLHRLKRSLQESGESPELRSAPGADVLASLTRRERDDENKPYRCNICKVAYAQSGPLDIHIKSVLHQTRASRLHELVMSGEVDIGKPLIDQPSTSERNVPNESEIKEEDADQTPEESALARLTGGKPSQVQKDLLRNYGMDVVMQFLEYQQRRFQEALSANGGTPNAGGDTGGANHNEALTPQVVEEMAEALKNRKPDDEELRKKDVKTEPEEVSESPLSQTGVSTSSPPQQPGNPNIGAAQFFQQMQEMNAALAAMQQMHMPINPMLMSGMGMPFMNPAALAAMNLQPPLLPFMVQPPFDPSRPGLSQHQASPNATGKTPQVAAKPEAATGAPVPRRGRTRITEDQLKVLRSYFDINNSPTEQQILVMAEQTGLPHKVIKHWFRNTLFKERQRNKDSPYNFNNPPQTSLNLEEYEKTGETKSVASDELRKPDDDNGQKLDHAVSKEGRSSPTTSEASSGSRPSSSIDEAVKRSSLNLCLTGGPKTPPLSQTLAGRQQTSPFPHSPVSGFPQVGTSPHPFFYSPTEQQPGGGAVSPPSSGSSTTAQSTGQTGSGKRANRTRFTDYQVKVLQEFFEKNAYPKDDDLEYLSKLLGLNPRVIVVWFQNARQKARKVYENQPANDPKDDGTGRFQRTAGLNYQCKKCLLVFQRYYELIRHQKSQCFKEEDAHKSAQAQAAAAKAAAAAGVIPPAPVVSSGKKGPVTSPNKLEHAFNCDTCGLSFARMEQWREHQVVHMMNPGLFLDAVGAAVGEEANALKRKALENLVGFGEDVKRIRTIPGVNADQEGILSRAFEMDSDPSQRMIETIAATVQLPVLAVQAWFAQARQNSIMKTGAASPPPESDRASPEAEGKGEKCPHCPSTFNSTSQLESHIAILHPSVNALSSNTKGGLLATAVAAMTSSTNAPFLRASPTITSTIKREGECPLDLSKPLDMASGSSSEKDLSFLHSEDTHSETYSEAEADMGDEGGNLSLDLASPHSTTSGHGAAGERKGNKRFRTQLTGTQLQVRKS